MNPSHWVGYLHSAAVMGREIRYSLINMARLERFRALLVEVDGRGEHEREGGTEF